METLRSFIQMKAVPPSNTLGGTALRAGMHYEEKPCR